MFIRTERLLLRPTWPDDVEEFLALMNDESVARNIGPWPLPETAEDARAFINQPWDSRQPHFFISLRQDGGPKLIGCIGLGIVDGEVELGYWIAPPYWNQGFASEAARALLQQAWLLGHERIFAVHFADNEATGRVLTKVGFSFDGEIRMRYCHYRGCEEPAKVYVAERPAKPSYRPIAKVEAGMGCVA